MTALVCYFAGALVGLAVVLLTVEALPRWREQNRRINEDVEFMRSIPKGIEGQGK